MSVKNILVPVDFSECSVRALRTAAEFAYYWDAQLVILHATHIPATYFAYGEPALEVTYEELDDEVTSDFTQLENEVPMLGILHYKKVEKISGLIDAVRNTVEQEEIDFIVMGTNSQHDRLETLFGTHSSDVIKNVDIPVLVLPENTSALEVERIAIGVDARSFSDINKLDVIFKIAANELSEMHLFYVSKDGESIDFNNSVYKDIFEEQYTAGSCFYDNIRAEDPVEGIKKFVKEKKIDLLVLFPRQHDFLERLMKGSVTQKLALEASIPILSVPH
jgi:nucleotide-binding universal stress UspA family protein